MHNTSYFKYIVYNKDQICLFKEKMRYVNYSLYLKSVVLFSDGKEYKITCFYCRQFLYYL